MKIGKMIGKLSLLGIVGLGVYNIGHSLGFEEAHAKSKPIYVYPQVLNEDERFDLVIITKSGGKIPLISNGLGYIPVEKYLAEKYSKEYSFIDKKTLEAKTQQNQNKFEALSRKEKKIIYGNIK